MAADETNAPAALSFQFASGAIVGARANQEDACLVHDADPFGRGQVLAVLADGMGGHVSGQVASNLACETYIASFKSTAGEEIGSRMASALEASNQALANAINNDADLDGMGCTLIAAYVDGQGMRWISVGDSSLLLFRGDELIRLNADHSYGNLLDKQADAGIISKEAALSDKRRRALVSALTGEVIPLQDLELAAYPLEPGDWIVVASDGLLTAEGDELARLIKDNSALPPQDVVDRLIAAVEEKKHPKQDNTTVIAIAVSDAVGGASA